METRKVEIKRELGSEASSGGMLESRLLEERGRRINDTLYTAGRSMAQEHPEGEEEGRE